MIGDFVEEHLGWILAAGVALLIGCLVLVASADADRKRAFLAECEADGNKRYRCEALWRSGEPEVVPMPVVIPVGR